jgi:hypothetical protein
MIVNAVTKSGTNAYSGTLSGYFRDDSLNAKDFIQQRVIPYSNQQISATFGGPVQLDRIHFFGSYEFEREPRTATFTSPYPAFNIDLPGTATLHSAMGKVDVQITPQSRFYARYARYNQLVPNHRATFNGIWEPGLGFQVSGLYFFGSGERFFTNYGGDRRQVGANVSWNPNRLRPDGTMTPRAALVGEAIHRVDVRPRKRFALGGQVALDGLAEMFNLFNHANYGSYVTAESNPNYGNPQFSANSAYAPRSVQLGFRLAF